MGPLALAECADAALARVTVKRSARISECGAYRYTLSRVWADIPIASTNASLWIMMNPSSADAERDDPTIRRVVGFSRGWGRSGAWIANLFAYRTSSPRALRDAARAGIDVVGPDNDDTLDGLLSEPWGEVVCAWGDGGVASAIVADRVAKLRRRLKQSVCLATTTRGNPSHPLYQPRTRSLSEWP